MTCDGFIPEISEDIWKARRREIWTLFWIGSIVVLMGLVMGSSQAMKSAWIEDLLSLLPAIVVLVALHFEKRGPDEKFRYGYRRVNSLAFLIAAAALTAVGVFLLFEAGRTLLMQEHPNHRANYTFWAYRVVGLVDDRRAHLFGDSTGHSGSDEIACFPRYPGQSAPHGCTNAEADWMTFSVS